MSVKFVILKIILLKIVRVDPVWQVVPLWHDHHLPNNLDRKKKKKLLKPL